MFNKILDLFTGNPNSDKNDEPKFDPNGFKNTEIAACALFIEVAKADGNFNENEKDHIKEILKDSFSIDNNLIDNLLKDSLNEVNESVSLYEFTEVLNKNLSYDQKLSVIKDLWTITLVDGTIDKYEDYIIKLISNNLHIEHRTLMDLKIKVKKEMSEN